MVGMSAMNCTYSAKSLLIFAFILQLLVLLDVLARLSRKRLKLRKMRNPKRNLKKILMERSGKVPRVSLRLRTPIW